MKVLPLSALTSAPCSADLQRKTGSRKPASCVFVPLETTGHSTHILSMSWGVEEVGSAISAAAKRGSDEKLSSFAAKRTNLFLSYSLTHAEGGMESVGSKPDFPSIPMP